MKYLVAVILASICCSSLVYGQARRHYGHEFPIIAGTNNHPSFPFLKKDNNSPLQSGDENWNPLTNLPQCNGIVHAIATIGWAASPTTIIGGEFDSIDGNRAHGIAMTTKNNDTLLIELGSGIDGVVYSICAISDTDIYAAGNFKTAGSIPANNIAHWNGKTWEALGQGTDTTVLAMTVVGDILFVGGNFITAGGVPMNHIAKWNITTKTWEPIFSNGIIGVDGGVAALAHDENGVVYVGGGFLTAGGDTVNKIVALDNGWKNLDGGVTGANSFASTICVIFNDVNIGGSFEKAGELTIANLATFTTGSGWNSKRIPVVNGPVFCLTNPLGNTLIIGGSFTEADDQPSAHIASNGLFSNSFGSGLDGPVYALGGKLILVALQSHGQEILVGGDFQTAGLKPSPYLSVFSTGFGAVKPTEEVKPSFSVYPNPSYDQITFENQDQISSLRIVNAIGQEVFSASKNDFRSSINVSTFPDGFYSAVITSDGKMYSEKFIVKH